MSAVSANDTKTPVLVRGRAGAAFPFESREDKTQAESSAAASSSASLDDGSSHHNSALDKETASLLAQLAALQDTTVEALVSAPADGCLEDLFTPPVVPSVRKTAAAAEQSTATQSQSDSDDDNSVAGDVDLLSALASAAAVAPPAAAAAAAVKPKPVPNEPQLSDSTAVLVDVASSNGKSNSNAAPAAPVQPDAEIADGGFQFFGAKSTLFDRDNIGFTFSAFNRVRCDDWERDITDKDCFVTCSGPGASTVQGFVCALGIKSKIYFVLLAVLKHLFAVYHAKKSSLLPFLLLYSKGHLVWCQAARVQAVEERQQATDDRKQMLFAFVEWEQSQVRCACSVGCIELIGGCACMCAQVAHAKESTAGSLNPENAETEGAEVAAAGPMRRRNPPRASSSRGAAGQESSKPRCVRERSLPG